jgi:hypothetical protein
MFKDKVNLLLSIFFLLSFVKVFCSEVAIYGNVSDTNGTNISEVIVKLISESGDIVRSTYTDESGNYSITFDINESGIDNGNSIPDNIQLYQNSPNPFSPITCIPFELLEPGNVQITVYNTLGQKINTIANGYFSEGYSQVFWNGLNRDGTPLTAGIYIYRLESQGEIRSGKMLLQEGESSFSIGSINKFTQKPLQKSQAKQIEKTYHLEAEKEGYFSTVDSSFIITSEDISIEKNLFLDDCSLDSFALYASVDGNFSGLWIFDANILEKTDSLETNWFPYSFEFSADYSILYYSTRDPATNIRSIVAINAKTKAISRQSSTRNINLILDWQKKYIITYYGSDYIQFYDAQTFELVYEDSLGLGSKGLGMRKMVASPTEDKVYAFYNSGQGIGIAVYNICNFEIERIINLKQNSNIGDGDLKISPDGRYLFAIVHGWTDSNVTGWYDSFIAIDITNDQVVAEYLCGNDSQIGVNPDGNYVYISDPAGHGIELMPTNQVLRYNVISKGMEVFINGSDDIGLKSLYDDYIYFITGSIVIASDHRTMFIALEGDITTIDGKDIHIAKIDTHTKKILDYYAIPRDYRGYITSAIWKIKLGKY